MHSTAFGDSLCEKMPDVDSMICLCIYNSFSFANDAGWVAGKDIGPRVAPLPPYSHGDHSIITSNSIVNSRKSLRSKHRSFSQQTFGGKKEYGAYARCAFLKFHHLQLENLKVNLKNDKLRNNESFR